MRLKYLVSSFLFCLIDILRGGDRWNVLVSLLPNGGALNIYYILILNVSCWNAFFAISLAHFCSVNFIFCITAEMILWRAKTTSNTGVAVGINMGPIERNSYPVGSYSHGIIGCVFLHSHYNPPVRRSNCKILTTAKFFA